ncbi:MAG: arylsulfotransferase family protein [Bacteroidia bacterium]|nr:arylsulfotransferase family protein [Bacteroidia bacterium]
MRKLKKILKPISVIVLVLTFLCLYGFSVAYICTGGKKLGPLTKPLKQFVFFPFTVQKTLESKEIRGIPLTYIKKDDSFKAINKLKNDVYGINSFLLLDGDAWEIKLFNLRTDSSVHSWELKKSVFNEGDGHLPFSNSPPLHSLLLPNRSLVTLCNATANLYRLDEKSNVVWHNTNKIFHHSLNIDTDNNIWACTSSARGLTKSNDSTVYSFIDDYITKIDVETGKVLYDKSVGDILIENGYISYVHGFTNRVGSKPGDDPIHLNDIEPVMSDSPYWKKGDLFLSLRNKSLILLYRPETNKIIHFLSGPFLNQHDVDIYSENEISLFNNNVTSIGADGAAAFVGEATSTSDSFSTAEILVYNFKDSTYRKHLKPHFDSERIYSFTQCLHEILSSGDVFVESQNNGTIYIMNNDNILLKKQFGTPMKHMIEQPNWIRLYENIDF